MSANIGRLLYRLSGGLSITPLPVLPRSSTFLWSPTPVLIQGAIRNYAARKGTRARKDKLKLKNKKAKKEKEEAAALQKSKTLGKMKQLLVKSLFPDESRKQASVDNVYFTGSSRWPVYDVLKAISNVKETHHPTMFDNPRAMIKGYFEFDLSTKKKTQFIEKFSGVVELPHMFETGKVVKSVCVFCKDQTLTEEATSAGAEMAVGLEGIKLFLNGELNIEDYDVVLSHPDVLPDLAPLRGLMSKKFPNIKKGTAAFDVVALVKKFKSGVEFTLSTNIDNPKCGFMEVPVGMVGMPSDVVEKNFEAVLKGVLEQAPANAIQPFITLGGITSQFSNERFKVSYEKYLEKEDDDSADTVAAKTPKEKAASL